MEVVAPAASQVLDIKPQLVATSYELDGEHDPSPPGLKLLAEVDIPGNWSGKGQHVEFARDEAIPLEQGTFLGRGTFADVYEVKCRGLSMARKQIYCTRRMRIAEVKRELDILKKLSHKHVVTLLGSYTQNNILGLLLHPVAACDLGVLLDELDENQKLAWADCSEDFKKLMDRLGFRDDRRKMRERLTRVYGCLANAIQYLHNNDIRHKDIKPRNILLDTNDGLYVTDFGLSRDTADASSSATDGIERGTYKYCAPEVAMYEPRGRAADIYSLGCVFLEINTVHRRLSLGAFENFRTEDNDRSYQNSPQKLQGWMSKLRQTRIDNVDSGIFDIVDIMERMVSPIAKDRPAIRDVCSSLYLLGDLIYFGKCCPSRRYQDLVDRNTKLGHECEILRTRYELHELEKAALVQEHRSEIDSMTKRLLEAEQHHLDESDRLIYEDIKMDLSPYSGSFNRLLESRQASFYPQGFDPRAMPVQGPPYMYPQMQQMQYLPPQSPQPGYQPSAYIPGQYAPQAQPISEQRPASSIRQPQTPSMTPPIPHTYTPQPKANSTLSPAFTRPTRKSAAIVIKRPDSEAIDVESFKAPAFPTPSARARTSPIITSTPTPPPKASTPQHARTRSAAIGGKTREQIRLELQELVKKAAEKAAADKANENERAVRGG